MKKMKNNRYWVERELKHAKSMVKDEKVINKRSADRYRQAAREVEKEINTLLDKFASDEGLSLADAKKEVSKIDIRDYEDKAKRYVKEKNFSDKANSEMKRYNLKMRISRLELIESHIDLELISLADEVDKKTYNRLKDVGFQEVKRQAGILGKTVDINDEAMDYIVNQEFYDSDFSSRIWDNKDLLHRELTDRLTESIIKGQGSQKAARILRDKIIQSVYVSERLLRTETARVMAEVHKESYDQNGFSQYEYIALEDACPICTPLDAQIFDVKDMEIGVNMFPMHTNCRCSTAAYMSREEWDEDLKKRGL